MGNNTINNYLDYYCIIGAGAAGIATVIQFNKSKIKYKVFEKKSVAGGVWQPNPLKSFIYEGLSTNTAKIGMYIQGYPHDKNVDYYMEYNYISQYLKKIMEKECDKQDIHYGVEIKEITNIDNSYWKIKDENNIIYHFKGIIVCAGNQSILNYHMIENANQTKQIHSSEYIGFESIKQKNIVVIGSGQTAIDILEQGLIYAKKIVHCSRNMPSWIITEEKSIKRAKEELIEFNYINKFPDSMKKLDRLLFFLLKARIKLLRKLIPSSLLEYLLKLSLNKKIRDSSAQLGFNNWDKEFSLNFYHVTKEFLIQYKNNTKISTKRSIRKADKKNIIFDDGSIAEDIDLIIHATGYKQEFSFLDNKDIVFHNKHDALEGLYFGFLSKKSNIFFVGHVYPWGSHWIIHEMQANLIAHCIKSRLNHDILLNIFKKDSNLLPYTIYNHGINFSRYIDIDKYLDQGKKYLNILKKCTVKIGKYGKFR